MARPRQLPEFSEYLRLQAEGQSSSSAADGFGCLASLGLSAAASYFLYVKSGFFAAALGFVGALVVSTIAIYSLLKWMGKPRNQEQKRKRELGDAVKFLSDKARTGSLRKVISPHAAAIFEFSARQWARMRGNLNSPTWSADTLPLHWKQVRDSIETSSNQSMQDLLLMLQPVAGGRFDKDQWFIYYDSALEELNDPSRISPQPIPHKFAHAVELAQKMRKLASEFEGISVKVNESTELRQQLGGRTAVDDALDDLRAFQVAEAELDLDRLP